MKERDLEIGSSCSAAAADWDASITNMYRRGGKQRYSHATSSSQSCSTATTVCSDSESSSSNNNNNDKLSLLNGNDSDSSLSDEHPSSPRSPIRNAGLLQLTPPSLSPHHHQYHHNSSSSKHVTGIWKRRLQMLLAWVSLSLFLYNSPGMFLEVAYFPAHGRMLPSGLDALLFKPTFHYEAVQAALADEKKAAAKNAKKGTSSIAASNKSIAASTASQKKSNLPTTTTTKSSVVSIPRIVHVTYKSRAELPESWKYSLTQWEAMNPGWEVRFWSDQDIANFVHKQYPHMEALHKSYKYTIQRVDSVRYMILHHFGGVYSDMDIYPATSLNKLLQQWEDAGKEVLLSETFNKGVTNAFMAAAPQSKFMECVIENLPHYQHKFHHLIGWQHWEVLSSAGSTFLWGMVGHCQQDDQVQILAARDFRGCSVCDAWESGKNPQQAPCDTQWFRHSSTNSSWHQHKSFVHAFFFTLSMGFFCRPSQGCFLLVFIFMGASNLLYCRRRSRRRSPKVFF